MAEIEDNSGSAFRSVGTSLRKVRNFKIKKLDRVDIILKVKNDIVVRSAPKNKGVSACAAPDAVISDTAIQGVVSKAPGENVVAGVAL